MFTAENPTDREMLLRQAPVDSEVLDENAAMHALKTLPRGTEAVLGEFKVRGVAQTSLETSIQARYDVETLLMVPELRGR
jgi:hypothetical protein